MFKKLFGHKKKPIKILGRGGIIYNDGISVYYIESDNMPPIESEVGVIIFYKRIRLMNDKYPMTDEERLRIANAVKSLLEAKGSHTKRIEISSVG